MHSISIPAVAAHHWAPPLRLWPGDAEVSLEVLSPLYQGCFLPDAEIPQEGFCFALPVHSFPLVSSEEGLFLYFMVRVSKAGEGTVTVLFVLVGPR